MFEIGWSEILVIAVVAIVVIGPKDLPRAMRFVGQWAGKTVVTRNNEDSSVQNPPPLQYASPPATPSFRTIEVPSVVEKRADSRIRML